MMIFNSGGFAAADVWVFTGGEWRRAEIWCYTGEEWRVKRKENV